MENLSQTRRTFLLRLALFLGSSALVARYLTPRTLPPSRVLLSVAKASIPDEGALVFRESRVALAKDRGEFYALSLVCTHLGCTVEVGAEELSCPCHGSRFDVRGHVLAGPAGLPLKRLRIVERGDLVEVMAG